MCFGSRPPPDNTGQQLLQQEQDRQQKVTEGNSAIDQAFSHFDNPYFQGYQDAYTGYYNPQVDQQFTDAKSTAEAGLARQGIDRSSVAATTLGRLYGAYADQKANIANQAVDAANALRSKVANEKSNLYALNASSADPAQATTQAQAAQTALAAPQSFSPLGNVFASFVAPFTSYANAYNNSGVGSGYVSPYNTSGRPSATVVR